MNSIVVSGRLTKQGDVYQKDDFKVYKNSIACQRDFKEKGKDDYVTDFIDFSAFGHTATYLEKYANKGDLIIIQGRLYFDEYTKDGEKRKKAYVRIDNANILQSGKKEQEPTQVGLQEVKPEPDFTDTEDDGNIPF